MSVSSNKKMARGSVVKGLSICDIRSMTAYVGRIANQRKVPKSLPFKNYKSESLNI